MVPPVAMTGEGGAVVKSKFWQRPLKDGRLETYISVEGHFLHIWADASVTTDVLRMFEESSGIQLPAQVERKPALYGRRRFKGALASQGTLFEVPAA